MEEQQFEEKFFGDEHANKEFPSQNACRVKADGMGFYLSTKISAA